MKSSVRLLNEQINILDTCRDLGIELEEDGGDDRYRALCPFHEETVPSFKVYGKDNSWHAYCCGKGGGSVHLISLVKGISIGEVIQEYGTLLPLKAARRALESRDGEEVDIDALRYEARAAVKGVCRNKNIPLETVEQYYRTIEKCVSGKEICSFLDSFVV